ncbi:MAG: hypothetical protein DCF16_12150 [Alphaproteobacteria bacterium]|nr:MAG: hypothetical protein DCF16_12150 [Alphaproteobacteria bacterium]
MSAGPIPLRYVEEPGGSRQGDRRSADRRAPRRWLDPLFAATLVNQIAPAETVYVRAYDAKPRTVRSGIAFDVRA